MYPADFLAVTCSHASIKIDAANTNCISSNLPDKSPKDLAYSQIEFLGCPFWKQLYFHVNGPHTHTGVKPTPSSSLVLYVSKTCFVASKHYGYAPQTTLVGTLCTLHYVVSTSEYSQHCSTLTTSNPMAMALTTECYFRIKWAHWAMSSLTNEDLETTIGISLQTNLLI